MPATSQRFNVGEIQCVAVNDGTFAYPPGWLFSNVPAEEVASSLRARKLPETHVESPYTCLLLKTGNHKILVDTGAGSLAPTTGDLLKNLSAEGVRPEEITLVVLTHGHPDHISGTLDANGKPAFPNAQYVISKTEWDFWNDSSALHDVAMDDHMKQLLVGCAQKNLPPLKGCVELFEGEKELVLGVYAIPAPGHTPGHIALVISSAHAQFLHMSDAVLNPLHLENPSWRSFFDLSPEDADSTRRRLLDRATADKMRVLAYHFPFPGLGRIENKGHAWKWQADS
jgi:glyoxylase-like metal-dependent hydrolase (beta-lactamase superfamily II)